MSIKEMLEKIKSSSFLSFHTAGIVVLTLLFLGFSVATVREMAGDGNERAAAILESQSAAVVEALPTGAEPLVANAVVGGEVIGSKSGKKYYYPWCGTLKRVKEENRVHFVSIDEARAAGYTPAKNCKGLQ